MLSPTLALRCPHCQHALALTDIRGAATCPACGEPHGLPPAVADALALYERAIQQAVSDLVRSGAAAGPTLIDAPAPAPTPAPERPAYAPSEPGPSASILATPVPATSSGKIYPNTLLSIGPAPAPRPAPPTGPAPVLTDSPAASAPPPLSAPVLTDSPAASAPPPAPAPVPTASPAEAIQAPVTGRPVDPAALSARAPVPSAGPTAEHPVVRADISEEALDAAKAAFVAELVTTTTPTVEFAPPGVPTVARPATTTDREPVPSASPPPAIGPASLSGLAVPDTLPGAAVPPSHSSLLSIVYGRSGAALAAAPLEVAAVREPAADRPPVRSTSELVAAVRSALPDRPDVDDGPEPEGRIPATALAVARRTLLARHADERRQQQVKEGSLGLFFAAVICAFLVVAGWWYAAVPIALLAIVLRLRREERGERLDAEVQRLADALGGQRLPGYDAIAAWFDNLWPAPVSPEAMWTSHLHGAVRCDVHGYAALVDVHLNEKTSGGVFYPPRITAYLAAIWPGRVPALRPNAPGLSPEAQARLTRLRKAGYTVIADAHGGLIMSVSEAIAQAARADITRLPALQVPIGELADLARDLGAEPVAGP